MDEDFKKKLDELREKYDEQLKKLDVDFEKFKEALQPTPRLSAISTAFNDVMARLIVGTPPSVTVKVLTDPEELEEFNRYCDEAKAFIKVDPRSLLSFLTRQMSDATLSFTAGDRSFDIHLRVFLGHMKVTVEFESPKGSRKFIIYEEG